jgi:hypothetical protein
LPITASVQKIIEKERRHFMDTQPMTTEETKLNKPSIFKFITSPSLEMEKIKQKPTIWIPLLIILLLGLIQVAIYSYIPNVISTGEAQMREVGMATEGLQMFTLISSLIGIVIVTPIILVISAAIMIAIAKIFKGQGTFKSYFSVSIFIMFISNIGSLFNTILAYFMDGKPQYTSLNGILNVTGNIGGLYGSIEIFAIWTSILTGFVFYKIANLSKGISIGLGIATFILGLVIGLATGGIQ